MEHLIINKPIRKSGENWVHRVFVIAQPKPTSTYIMKKMLGLNPPMPFTIIGWSYELENLIRWAKLKKVKGTYKTQYVTTNVLWKHRDKAVKL